MRAPIQRMQNSIFAVERRHGLQHDEMVSICGKGSRASDPKEQAGGRNDLLRKSHLWNLGIFSTRRVMVGSPRAIRSACISATSPSELLPSSRRHEIVRSTGAFSRPSGTASMLLSAIPGSRTLCRRGRAARHGSHCPTPSLNWTTNPTLPAKVVSWIPPAAGADRWHYQMRGTLVHSGSVLAATAGIAPAAGHQNQGRSAVKQSSSITWHRAVSMPGCLHPAHGYECGESASSLGTGNSRIDSWSPVSRALHAQ